METIEDVVKYLEINQDKPFVSVVDKIEKLSGGLVNYVYRIKFVDKKSVILKHYPPYCAAYKTISMSQKRYFVEKEALQFLSTQPWLTNNPESIVRTPNVIYADDDHYTLIMQDAGENTQTLFNLLLSNSSVDQHFLDLIPKELKVLIRHLTEDSELTFKKNKTFEKESVGGYLSLEKFQNQLGSMAKKIDEKLKPFSDISNGVSKSSNHENSVFVYGDLWPSSILIDKEENLIWIVDWEFARYESKTSDLEQLLANLWVMKQSSKFNQDKIEKLIEKFQLEFLGNEKSDWRYECGDMAKYNFILWIGGLLNETHWGIDDNQAVALKALEEVNK
ncbi:unnamed protein product [Brachionus calyciflorus]|uniref:Aminoglycoside phosphotransferase domain-containing protein n=1 Tax=Brachionus calyciflorus TaxID=104777 RepID=A0A813TBW6_9BILA|nr:unnamed protein product [Brachionus calyciflorus]